MPHVTTIQVPKSFLPRLRILKARLSAERGGNAVTYFGLLEWLAGLGERHFAQPVEPRPPVPPQRPFGHDAPVWMRDLIARPAENDEPKGEGGS